MTEILVLGLAVIDFVFAVDTFPSTPEKHRANDARIVGGGPAANASAAVSRLGGKPRVVARLGDDPVGDMIVADLQSFGVETSNIHRAPGGRSGFSSVLIDGTGERQIVNFRGSGLVEATDWISSVPFTGAVLVDTRWPEGAAVALDAARARGVPGVLDGEAPIDRALLQKASHVAFSAQGLNSLYPDGDLGTALAALAQDVPGWACVTDGANGVWYTAEQVIAHIPAFSVKVVDTLGAGDVWHGAFALSLAEGASEVEAIRFANAAAALKCMTFGGRAGTPTRSAVLEFLKENG